MFPGTTIVIGDFLLLCFSRWVNLVGLCWVLRHDFTGSELPIEMRSFAFYEIVFPFYAMHSFPSEWPWFMYNANAGITLVPRYVSIVCIVRISMQRQS